MSFTLLWLRYISYHYVSCLKLGPGREPDYSGFIDRLNDAIPFDRDLPSFDASFFKLSFSLLNLAFLPLLSL